MKRAKTKVLPTQESLKRILEYDQDTGIFRWKARENPTDNQYVRRFNSVYAGEIAANPTSHGYLRIVIDGKEYLAHRVAYKWMTGEEPPKMLDHEDTNRSNNKWKNIREANSSLNQGNTAPRSLTGVRGVSYCEKTNNWKFTANYTFETFEEAKTASELHNATRFGEFAFRAANDNSQIEDAA